MDENEQNQTPLPTEEMSEQNYSRDVGRRSISDKAVNANFIFLLILTILVIILVLNPHALDGVIDFFRAPIGIKDHFPYK